MKPATESATPMSESAKGDFPPPFLLEVTSSIPDGGELERAQERIKQLEQTVRERDLLVGIISHERP